MAGGGIVAVSMCSVGFVSIETTGLTPVDSSTSLAQSNDVVFVDVAWRDSAALAFISQLGTAVVGSSGVESSLRMVDGDMGACTGLFVGGGGLLELLGCLIA